MPIVLLDNTTGEQWVLMTWMTYWQYAMNKPNIAVIWLNIQKHSLLKKMKEQRQTSEQTKAKYIHVNENHNPALLSSLWLASRSQRNCHNCYICWKVGVDLMNTIHLTSDVCYCCRWVMQAMRLELSYANDKEMALNSLSPSGIKKLLHQVLTKTPPEQKERSVHYLYWGGGTGGATKSDIFEILCTSNSICCWITRSSCIIPVVGRYVVIIVTIKLHRMDLQYWELKRK